MVTTRFALPLLLALYGVSLSTSYSTRHRRLAETAVSEVHVTCSEGWFSFGDMCYKRFGQKKNKRLNWDQAAQACLIEHSGNLVTIDSQELQDFLTAFLILSAKAQVWIGLHDRRTESNYVWEDGTPVNYTNWAPGEPTGAKTAYEDCTEVLPVPLGKTRSFGYWNDAGCGNRYQYICQKKKGRHKKVHQDPRFCTENEGGGWKFDTSCFRLVTVPMTWLAAKQYCVDHHDGHLVTVIDAADHFYLSYVYPYLEQSWIGLKINPDEEEEQWGSGWFDTFGDSEDLPMGCVVFVPNQKLKYTSCTKQLPFICEYSSVREENSTTKEPHKSKNPHPIENTTTKQFETRKNSTEVERSKTEEIQEGTNSNHFPIGVGYLVAVMVCVLFAGALIGIALYRCGICKSTRNDAPSGMIVSTSYRSPDPTANTEDKQIYENVIMIKSAV